MKDVGSEYRIGGEDYFVFEACEYMDSFLDFYPTVAVVLNIEMDHVDYFHSMEQIRNSYAAFMAKTGEDGIALVNMCDDDVMKSAEGYKGRLVSILSCQIISNVPSAILLSQFTQNYRELLLGVNIGGVGTLIASLASLITFKEYSRQAPGHTLAYVLKFSAYNFAFLFILIGFCVVFGI